MTPSLRACWLLVPCSGLDDFPDSLPEDDADELLSAWLALWHPQLLATTRAAPRRQSASQPPPDFDGILALAPACAQPLLPSDLSTTARHSGGWLVSPQQAVGPAASPDLQPKSATSEQVAWRQWQSQLLATVGLEPEARLDASLVLEFAALGYAYLQIQLLTKQLRYTSNLDQVLFDSQLDQAAQAALRGDRDRAETMVQSCFDQLGQERDHYYSLDVSLLDVTLLAKSTLGGQVSAQLARPLPTTFVASASLLRLMRQQHAEVADHLQQALHERRVALAGGLDSERPHPLLSFDSLKRDLARGRLAYTQLGLAPPTVFTRFTFGQSSEMPLHLRRSGYTGAMLVAWQEGQYPRGSHSKFSWEASEGTFLNAIAPPLADANSAATYLALGKRIAEALDHQHVPVFMLAHWPDRYSTYYELLARVVHRTPALGRWQKVDEFFDKTDQPYHEEHLPARKFLHDYLTSAGQASDDLIQATVKYWRLSSQARRLQNLVNLIWQLEHYHQQPASPVSSDAAPMADYVEPGPQALPLDALDLQLHTFIEKIDGLLDALPVPAETLVELDRVLHELIGDLTRRFALASGYQLDESSEAAGILMVNATGAPQRAALNIEALGLEALGLEAKRAPVAGAGWLYASGLSQDQNLSMIDLPGYSALPIPLGPRAASAGKRAATLMPGQGWLQNDFLEAQVDLRTGSLRSLHVPGKRGNRLSLQIARREKLGSQAAQYSQMHLRQLVTVENSPLRGAIRAHGVLQWQGADTADFVIDYELWRGQRILHVTLRLSNLESLAGSAWNDSYVLRTAWPSPAASLSARSGSTQQSFPAGKLIAAELIGIDDVEHRIYLLPAGLAFHQRIDERFMDTILTQGRGPMDQGCGPMAQGGGPGTEFRLGIGVDLPSPVVAAEQFINPPLTIPIARTKRWSPEPSQCAAAWLMHVDAKSVLMNLEAPLVDQQAQLAGMRIHLSELSGQSVTARVRALREVREAHRVDYLGGRLAKLTVAGDMTTIALRPNEMTFVDLIWK